MNELMQNKIEDIISRAISQNKLDSKDNVSITINQYGNAWLQWRNTRRSFRFTVYQDGNISSGLSGK